MTDFEPEAEPGNQADEQRRTKLAALEAVLFMAAEPLPLAEVAEILEASPEEADALLRQLDADYAQRGMQLTRVAGGYQVSTRPEYGPYVAKLHKPERFRLSRAALETLAIVAYKQPTTRPEIDAVRGVNSDSPLDTLVQYDLVCEVGRKEAPGRPVLYRTTQNFLGYFGLNSIEDLPRLDAIPVAEPESEADSQQSPVDDREQEQRTEPDSPGSPEHAVE
jgi:segregation and condensation protein B